MDSLVKGAAEKSAAEIDRERLWRASRLPPPLLPRIDGRAASVGPFRKRLSSHAEEPVCSAAMIGCRHTAHGASSSTPSASVIGLFEKQTLSLQVCDPHNCDHVAIIERLLFCVLVARPDKVLLARKGLFILHKPKLPFSDMADHSILHRGTHGL